MKTKSAILLTVVTLALALCFSAIAPAAPNAAPAPAAVASLPSAAAPAAVPAPPPHPEIRDALEALRKARAHIADAAHDFGGHRAEALRATDEAIRQLEICTKYE